MTGTERTSGTSGVGGSGTPMVGTYDGTTVGVRVDVGVSVGVGVIVGVGVGVGVSVVGVGVGVGVGVKVSQPSVTGAVSGGHAGPCWENVGV